MRGWRTLLAATNRPKEVSMSSPERMRLITPDGVLAIDVHDQADRTLVAQHANAVRHFLDTGETEPLDPFRGVLVAGHQLLTDPDAIEAWAYEGELEFEDIYDLSGQG